MDMYNEEYEMNDSRKNTLEWINDNIDRLKLSNESESIDDVVAKMIDVGVGGPIGITREMLEGTERR
jgi:hypothetical protein